MEFPIVETRFWLKLLWKTDSLTVKIGSMTAKWIDDGGTRITTDWLNDGGLVLRYDIG
jgi:hypothetical protein